LSSSINIKIKFVYSKFVKVKVNHVQWDISVIPAFGRLRPED
jgi:hypothetical protein